LAREVWDGAQVPPGIDLTAIGARVWQQERSLDEERRLAPALLAELEALTPEGQSLMARNSPRFASRAICELLCEQAIAACATDVDLAMRRAELATMLADSPALARYGRGISNDLGARAWSVLGHAQREASRLSAADHSFQRAEALLHDGSGEPCHAGWVWYLEAILRHAQRRFDEALALYRRAGRAFTAGRDIHMVGSTRIDRARTLREIGDLEAAVRSVRAGLAQIDRQRSPRMALVGKHNLTLYLQELGESDQAAQLIDELLPLHARVGGEIDKVRLRWLEGKIAHMRGDLEGGQTAFEEVRQAFLHRSMPYDVALVSLDLAAIHLGRKRLDDVLRLAAETLAIFRALEIDREAIAALALLERAAAERRVSRALLAQLAGYLNRARNEPGLAFETAVD
jgi:tetratricopeptide (TPR) repeat protein